MSTAHYGYVPIYYAPPAVVPYRGAAALLTTLALLGALPTSTTSLYTTYSPFTTSTPTPTYSTPSYSTSSTGIGLTTALLLAGGGTSTTTLLALGI